MATTGGAPPAPLPSSAAVLPAIETLVPVQVLRNLSDRSFDKRKLGAQEIERIMRKYRDLPGAPSTLTSSNIRRILTVLAHDYACNVNSNHRKGGLIALASAAIGLGNATAEYLDILIPSILKSFSDGDPRVRYYACESLFNVVKCARSAMLPHFNDVFVGVARLVADSDNEVKNGAGLLDRLMKEIVMESESVDVARFIPLLRAHMVVVNPYVRQLLVGWITALDSVPGIEMLDYLPDLLEGLFSMLSDGNREIRQQAYTALSEFLDQIGKVPPSEFPSRVSFKPIVDILIAQTSRERDKFNRVTAVEWLTALLSLSASALTPVYDVLVSALLRCMSDSEAEIVSEASKANMELMHIIRATPVAACERALPVIIRCVTVEARARDRVTRSAALRWMAMLLAMAPEAVRSHSDDVLAALLGNLVDTDDSDVLRLDLEVLARLSVYDLSLLRTRILVDLVRVFADNRPLLESKGSFILRRLCLLLEPRIIYVSLARILLHTSNREFASLLVELLNLILLTAVELTELRDLLRGCGARALTLAREGGDLVLVPDASLDACTDDADGAPVFLELYRTWCHNPVATYALCLLAQAYELGARIITRFAETTISVGVLMQVDKLVQLLETPIFLHTRLHLCAPERPDHAALMRSLYGLLMLLPQGTAFVTLRDRLNSVTSLHIALMPHTQPGVEGGSGRSTTTVQDDIDSVFGIFTENQKRQREALSADLHTRSVLRRYAQLSASTPATVRSTSAASSSVAGMPAVTSVMSSTATATSASGGVPRPSAPEETGLEDAFADEESASGLVGAASSNAAALKQIRAAALGDEPLPSGTRQRQAAPAAAAMEEGLDAFGVGERDDGGGES